MIFRQSNQWELWAGVHPSNIGCVSEGREQCHCKFHVVSKDRTKIYSFEDWQEADKKFTELTKEKRLEDLLIKHN